MRRGSSCPGPPPSSTTTLVASKYGWSAVPPGTRTSLYNNPNYQKAAKPFADITLESINSTDPEHPTLNPVPYVGVQYVDIPQFESLGLTVGQQIAGAIAGTESVSQALQAGQSAASQYTAGAIVRRLARTVSRALWRGPAHRAPSSRGTSEEGRFRDST